jgi:hypothetical protein
MSACAAALSLSLHAPPPASGWSGDLIRCQPTPGTPIDVVFKKGLTCSDTLNKIQIKAKVKDGLGIDGCVANPVAPWDFWASKAAKWQKTDLAGAMQITTAEIALKGKTFGSCNFAGSDISAGASGAGQVVFFGDPPAPGAKAPKVKGAALKFFGTVGGDVSTYSADARGLVTKGLGLGMDILVRIGLDLGAPENGLTLACNTGGICTDTDPDSPTFDDPFASVPRCLSGPNAGLSCSSKDDCDGDKCSAKHTLLCSGGGNDGLACADDGDCPDGSCKLQDPAIEPIGVLKVVTAANSMLLISSGEDDPNDPNDYDALP